MRVGRIPYINCYPVYGAIDRGIVQTPAELVSGLPTALNEMMHRGELDVSVVSAVEYANHSDRYLLLPDLAISCEGPVRSVMLFARRPVQELTGRRVVVSRSSMTSVALLDLLFSRVWNAAPDLVPGNSELTDVESMRVEPHDARLVIGDAALLLANSSPEYYPFVYDLGLEWLSWTGLPFVFAVWVAQRSGSAEASLAVHASLLRSRQWGLENLDTLAAQAASRTSLALDVCREYLGGLDYRLDYRHLDGLTTFLRMLADASGIRHGNLRFLTAA